MNLYWARGISIKHINADNEFECAKPAFPTIFFNIVAADEYAGDIERSNRTLRDSMRTIVNDLPFTHCPRALIAGCAMYSIQWLNWIPKSNGLSNIMGEETLITGIQPPDFDEITKINFGDYALVDNGKSSNDTKARRIPAITLFPSKNTSGIWNFMSLLTGNFISTIGRFNLHKIGYWTA